MPANPLIIALDVNSTDAALKLIDQIGPSAGFYKIGMELYAVGAMSFVRAVHARGKRVFLDLKLYDIGETVKRVTRFISETGTVHLLTVHGSRRVMEAAAEGRGSSLTKLLAVTVLTSFDAEDIADLGYRVPVSELVDLRVTKALQSKMDGVVCSPLEVSRVRAIGGNELILVTPGVRSAGAEKGDQKRVATPAEAYSGGADYMVIGRQVTRAADPRAAYEAILGEIGFNESKPSRVAALTESA